MASDEGGTGQVGGQQKNKVTVRICGEEYVIKGEASPEYMAKLAAEVDGKLRAISSAHRNLPFHRMAVLAAIHLADDLERSRAENTELLGLIEEAR